MSGEADAQHRILDRKLARLPGRKDRLLDRVSAGAIRSRLASQLLLSGRPDADGPRASRWELV